MKIKVSLILMWIPADQNLEEVKTIWVENLEIESTVGADDVEAGRGWVLVVIIPTCRSILI